MTTFNAWTRSGSERSGRVHRCYEVTGADAVIRDDCVTEILERAGIVRTERLRGSEVGTGAVWDTIGALPFGSGARAVLLTEPERVDMSPLRAWLDDRGTHVETTLVLISERGERGRRIRNRVSGKWETELSSWQQWISDTSAAITIECPTPSVEVVGSSRGQSAPSAAAVWLSRRVPVTQRQAEYLWRRVGGSSVLARDVVEQLRLLGVVDATVIGQTDFVSKIDVLVTAQGAESLTEDLLFNRRDAVLTTLASRMLDRAEWSKIIGLLAQRLEWLSPLYHALNTRESLSTVASNIGIHEKWILHYAHREDTSHNIARFYSPRRVAACRTLLASLDSALAASSGVPEGLGEVLVSSW